MRRGAAPPARLVTKILPSWTHATCCPSGEMAVWSIVFREKSVVITSLRAKVCCWPEQRVQINMTKTICLEILDIQVFLCELRTKNPCRPHSHPATRKGGACQGPRFRGLKTCFYCLPTACAV